MSAYHYLRTGQRTCHFDDGSEVPCEGSGQDASFAVGTPWPQPRFDVRDDEMMDRLTGLIWCRTADLAEFPLIWQFERIPPRRWPLELTGIGDKPA